MKREQIIEILENHEVSFYGTEGGYGVQECDYSKIADAILTLESKQIEKYKELIKAYSEVCTYLVNQDALTPKGISSLEQLSDKIKQLKTELGL